MQTALSASKSNFASRILGLCGVGVTIVVNPWFAYDPINLSKMMVLSTVASIMFAGLVFKWRNLFRAPSAILILLSIFLLAMFISAVANKAPLSQELYGTWGRSTGLITYVSLVIVAFYTASMVQRGDVALLRRVFERLSYFVTIYTLIQWADIDPINWSQKLMVATLGNINFMSSFLGMASCTFLVRIFVDSIPIHSKAFFASMVALNLLLIKFSDSIQGLAIFLVGCWLVLSLLVRRKLGKAKMMFFALFTAAGGLFVLLGTAGLGPLRALRQDTVIFRIDYWKAGWSMARDNALFGVGIDSYGDFYRQYRDLDAVIRTGPQRVTNTAHNIFLDLSSGSGIAVGIAFFLVICFLTVFVFKNLYQDAFDEHAIAWSTIFLGYVVFCLISINQIGVAVWGFIAIGIIAGEMRLMKTTSDSIESDQKKFRVQGYVASTIKVKKKNWEKIGSNSQSFGQALMSVVVALVVFYLTFIPNLVDSKFLSAIRSNDLNRALKLSDDFGAMDFHREILMQRLKGAGKSSDSLILAKETVLRNPRNWSGWVEIALNPDSSDIDRKVAVENLLKLDPNNELTRSELELVLEELD